MANAAAVENMEYLQYCFFIYDDYHADEMAKDEDLMIYFHPSSVDIKKYVSSPSAVAFAQSKLQASSTNGFM